MNERDFLQGYEIKNWEFSPRIYKIMAAATVFNILGLLVMAQTNFISASACESPFVSRVCSVLDTVYVGSKLFSGEKDYVVKDYTRTEIEDADIVWVDSTNAEPQMSYPTGYFEIANRDELAAERLAQEMAENGFNTTPYTPGTISPSTPPAYTPPVTRRPLPKGRGSTLANRKPIIPKKKDNITDGKVDDELFVRDTEENVADKDKNTDDKDNSADKNPIRDKAPTDSNAVPEVEINKQPLLDLADGVLVKWEKDKALLSKKFAVKVSAKLTKDGRLDEKETKYIGHQGDEDIVNVAKDAIEAVGDSGWLSYLTSLDIDKFELTIVQDDENLHFLIVSPQTSEQMARTKASGLNGMISIGKMTTKGKDEQTLLKSAQVTNNGKDFVLKAVLPKKVAKEMMDRKLGEALAKKNEKGSKNSGQPNGTVKQNGSNETLAK